MSQPPPPPPPPPPDEPPPGSWSSPPPPDHWEVTPAGYGATPPSPWGDRPPGQSGTTDSIAVGALVCGILAVPLAIFCGVGIVPAVTAIVLGSTSRRKIARSFGTLEGRGMATAGLVLGWVGVVLAVLVVALVIVLAATGELDEDTATLGLQVVR